MTSTPWNNARCWLALVAGVFLVGLSAACEHVRRNPLCNGARRRR